MFYTIEEKSENEVVANFRDGRVVRLVRETDGDENAYVEGVRIFSTYGQTWDFPHGEEREVAIAEAEQRFRDVVTAIAEDTPLNFSDFVMKPTRSKASTKKATVKKTDPEPEPETPAEQPSE